MDQITVYYDGDKSKCREYAEFLSKIENVTCKNAADYTEEFMIQESNSVVGFIYESGKETIPYSIKHVIWRLIMNKNGKCFVIVLGGSKELLSLREAAEELETRGYTVVKGYTQYFFEKNKMKPEESAAWVLNEVENHQEGSLLSKGRELKEELKTSSDLRKKLRKERKNYRMYRKNIEKR